MSLDLRTPGAKVAGGFASFLKIIGVLILLVLAGLTVLMFTTCRGQMVSKDKAVEAAEAYGFKDVKVLEEHRVSPGMVGGCSGNDAAAFDLAATNSNAMRVNIVACCGWPFKGCTIRVK